MNGGQARRLSDRARAVVSCRRASVRLVSGSRADHRRAALALDLKDLVLAAYR